MQCASALIAQAACMTSPPFPAPRDLANLAHAGIDLGVQRRVLAECVVQIAASAEQSGQMRLEVLDRIRLVGAVVAHRPFRAGAAAVPDLALGITPAHEQQVLGLAAAHFAARREYGDRVRFREAGQIRKIAVLAKAVVRVARAHDLARARHDGDTVRADRLHQARAPRRVFLAGEAGDCHLPCLFWISEDAASRWDRASVVDAVP
jgi:hypothetical protein